MDSLDVSGLAQQIAARAMEEAKGIINRAFDGIGSTPPKGKLTATITVPTGGWKATDASAIKSKRGRKPSTETMRIVDALRGGMTNKDAAAKYRRTTQYMTILRTRYGLPKRAYRKAA